MVKTTSNNRNPGRRSFLAAGWTWLRWLAGALLLYPVFSFLAYRTPKKQRHVEVHKVVPPGGFAVEHDFILFVDETGPWAVSRKCTHLGCRLNYQDQEGVLLCPCHQSRFSREGLRLSGPAQKDLPRFQVARLRDEAQEKGYRVTM
jgi:nitrite reductase/ring-hydroxylating ferredoxin subunit